MEQDKKTQKESFFRRFWKKTVAWCRRHPVVSIVVGVLFVSTFFVRAESVEIRYAGDQVYEYVRMDYSVYGYCVNVVPMNEVSMDTAKDLKKVLLFSNVDKSVDTVVQRWVYYRGDQEQFTFRVKGYLGDPIQKRSALIEKVKAKGYAADALV